MEAKQILKVKQPQQVFLFISPLLIFNLFINSLIHKKTGWIEIIFVTVEVVAMILLISFGIYYGFYKKYDLFVFEDTIQLKRKQIKATKLKEIVYYYKIREIYFKTIEGVILRIKLAREDEESVKEVILNWSYDNRIPFRRNDK
jgi:hypothetical protein